MHALILQLRVNALYCHKHNLYFSIMYASAQTWLSNFPAPFWRHLLVQILNYRSWVTARIWRLKKLLKKNCPLPFHYFSGPWLCEEGSHISVWSQLRGWEVLDCIFQLMALKTCCECATSLNIYAMTIKCTLWQLSNASANDIYTQTHLVC